MQLRAESRLVINLINEALDNYESDEFIEDVARQFKGCTLRDTPSNPPYSYKELIKQAAYPESKHNLVNDSIDLFFEKNDQKLVSINYMKELMLELGDSNERYDILLSLIFWNKFAPNELYKIWKERLTTILRDNM